MTGTPIPKEPAQPRVVPDPPSNTQNSPPSPTQPTSEPSAPPTEDVEKLKADLAKAKRIIDAQKDVIRERREPTSASTPPAAAPEPVSSGDDSKRFWDAPRATIREDVRSIIAEELKTLSAPLNASIIESKLEGMKNQVRSQYGSDFDLMEPYFDQTVQTAIANGTKPSREVFEFIANGIWAQLVRAGQLSPSTFSKPSDPPPSAPPPQPGAPQVTNPPHLRPSAPTSPGAPSNTPKLRPLSENEARLAREHGLSHAEYLAWMDEDSVNVPTSKIGKEGWNQ